MHVILDGVICGSCMHQYWACDTPQSNRKCDPGTFLDADRVQQLWQLFLSILRTEQWRCGRPSIRSVLLTSPSAPAILKWGVGRSNDSSDALGTCSKSGVGGGAGALLGTAAVGYSGKGRNDEQRQQSDPRHQPNGPRLCGCRLCTAGRFTCNHHAPPLTGCVHSRSKTHHVAALLKAAKALKHFLI